MNYSSVLNDLSLKSYMYFEKLTPILILGFIVACLFPDLSFAGTNHLAGLKDEVASTFGAKSDTPYFILLAEGLAGAYAYMKTKNIAVLAGVPVLMIFTNYALK
jgi:type IV conjugative transfer system pilin TraA